MQRKIQCSHKHYKEANCNLKGIDVFNYLDTIDYNKV